MIDNFEKKIIIVTGANSGIGKAAVLQLAKLGATVVMACRSDASGVTALEEVRQASGNDRLDLMRLDLASQASIRQFAGEFQQRYPRLDVLIHNAANFDLAMKKPVMTGDGYETIFATNHLGPFLLTHLLLDTLKKSAPSRILTVASKGLAVYPRLDIEFDNLNGERRFDPQHAYYHSKLAQIMFTYDLTERLKDYRVTVNCVRVGNVAIPDERLAHLPKWLLKLYAIKRSLALTPEKMAETYVHLATDGSLEGVTGKYWDENNREVKSNPAS